MTTEHKDREASVDSSNSNAKTNQLTDESHLEKGPAEVRPASLTNSVVPCPDGGWRAWSVVLGVSVNRNSNTFCTFLFLTCKI
jgi:hypothetical protein